MNAEILFPLLISYIGSLHDNNNPQGVRHMKFCSPLPGEAGIRRREKQARMEEFQDFCAKFLFPGDSGWTAPQSEGEDCRILKKISPFERRPGRGVGAGKRKLPNWGEKFSLSAQRPPVPLPPPGQPGHPSEQIQFVCEVDFFPYIQLILGLGHVVKDEFKKQGAAQAAALNLELVEAHGKIDVLNVLC